MEEEGVDTAEESRAAAVAVVNGIIIIMAALLAKMFRKDLLVAVRSRANERGSIVVQHLEQARDFAMQSSAELCLKILALRSGGDG